MIVSSARSQRGYAMNLPTLWSFASDGYPGRIDHAYTRRTTVEDLAAELVDSMMPPGAIVTEAQRLHAAAEHTPVRATALEVPPPRSWPVTPRPR